MRSRKLVITSFIYYKFTLKKIIISLGNIVVIGVNMDDLVKLGTIETSFRCLKTNEECKILGVVEYRGPPVTSNSAGEIGHYDDTKKKSYLVNDDYNLTIELLFYYKL